MREACCPAVSDLTGWLWNKPLGKILAQCLHYGWGELRVWVILNRTFFFVRALRLLVTFSDNGEKFQLSIFRALCLLSHQIDDLLDMVVRH